MIVQLENTYCETKSYPGYYSSPKNKQANKTSQRYYLYLYTLFIRNFRINASEYYARTVTSLGIRYILVTVSIPFSFV